MMRADDPLKTCIPCLAADGECRTIDGTLLEVDSKLAEEHVAVEGERVEVGIAAAERMLEVGAAVAVGAAADLVRVVSHSILALVVLTFRARECCLGLQACCSLAWEEIDLLYTEAGLVVAASPGRNMAVCYVARLKRWSRTGDGGLPLQVSLDIHRVTFLSLVSCSSVVALQAHCRRDRPLIEEAQALSL